MRSAARLYRLNVAFAALGLAIVLLGGLAATRDASLGPASLETLIAACRSLVPSLTPAGYAELALAGLAAASLVLAARSLARQLLTTRRYLRGLRASGATIEIAGADCLVIEEAAPRALCAGYLVPRIYVSRGALELLGQDELRAVVAHELHHRRRRDPLRLLVTRILADALCFLPVLRWATERHAELVEIAADEAAVCDLGERRTLAAALLAFGAEGPLPAGVAGIAPERVDHLGGDTEAGRWRLPTGSLVVSAATAVALVAGTLVVTFAPGAARLNFPVALAESCMLLMVLGAIVVAVGGGRILRAASRLPAS